MPDTTNHHMVEGLREKELFSPDEFTDHIQRPEELDREMEESCYGNLLLGQIAIRNSLISAAQLDRLLVLQKQRGEKLGRLMVHEEQITDIELGRLLDEQRDLVRKLLDEERRAIMLCKKCGTGFNVHVPDSNAIYRCRNCRAVLVRKPAPQSMIPRDNSIKPEPDTEMPHEVRIAAALGNEMFGKYLILKNVGNGGGGIVYRAFDVELERIVALKIISYSTELDLERTRTGALLAARLENAGIPRVYEAGFQDGVHFIAMQYIDGCTLEGRELPLNEALRICKEVAEILHFAHACGIIHRDVKPSNIMVDSQGRVWLTDFGIAKPTRGRTKGDTTGTGDIVGTPQFMSPEQAEGKIRELDSRSDVFSLGATLYYIVTGSYPFSAPNLIALVKKIISSDPAPISSMRPDIPREIEAIVNKATEKEKERRYRSAKEFAQDIQRFLNGDAVLAKPAGLREKIGRKIRRNKRIFAVAASAAFVFLVLAGFGTGEFVARKRAEEISRGLIQTFIENVSRRHAEALESRKKGASFDVLSHLAASTQRDYGELAKLGIRSAQVEYSLGRVYRIVGDESRAQAHFERAVSMELQFADANYELGVLLYRAYNRRMEKIIDSRKRNSAFQLAPAQDDEIASRLKEGAKEHLSSARSVPATAILLFLEGNSEAAHKVLQNAPEESSEDAVELLVRINLQRNSGQEALKILSEAIDADIGNTHFRMMRARVHYDRGERDVLSGRDPAANYAAALLDWDAVIRLNSTLPEPLANIGRTHNATGVFMLDRGEDPTAEFKTAISFLERAGKIDNGNSDTLVLLGSVRGNLGFVATLNGKDPAEEYSAALSDFNRAIVLDPANPRAWQSRGHLFMNRANYNKERAGSIGEDLKLGLHDYDRALELDGSDVQIRSERGWLSNNFAMFEFRSGRDPSRTFERAISDFDSAIRLRPDIAELFRKRATIRVNASLYKIKTGADFTADYKAALKDFQSAIDLNPADAQSYRARAGLWNNWGLHKWHSGQEPDKEYESALADLSKGIELNPADFDAYLSRGDVLLNRGLAKADEGAFKRAALDYTQALKLNSTCVGAYRGKGIALMQIGRITKARSAYEEALENFKKAAAINAGDADVWIQMGEAHGYLANLTSVKGGDARAEFEEALHSLDIALQISASDDRVLALRAGIRVNCASLAGADPFPDYELAMKDITRALELNPSNPAAWSNKGLLHYNRAHKYGKVKKYESAVADFLYAADAWKTAVKHDKGLEAAYSARIAEAERCADELQRWLDKEY